ncbi:hypothetical protein [Streptomyces griseorubiginosus]|uniref:hypothetical protein n=1 Tax=Streptomyces griseorubiginosus TaxID=67304 RepID=UPI0015E84CCC|nr:hypothetical protein [Streptomyces griseorubiginosus]
MEQFDGLLTGLNTVLSGGVLDQIDQLAPPGVGVGSLDQAYVSPSAERSGLPRCPIGD